VIVIHVSMFWGLLNRTRMIRLNFGHTVSFRIPIIAPFRSAGVAQDALVLAHRALAAFRALRRRCSGVMLSARRLPPIFPPSRPSSDRSWDLRDLAGCVGSADSGSIGGRSPNNLCTAMKPAWTSSSGSLPDGFRIHSQRCTFGSAPSSPGFFKVAHYRFLGTPFRPPSFFRQDFDLPAMLIALS
jgi:hypothetical protein